MMTLYQPIASLTYYNIMHAYYCDYSSVCILSSLLSCSNAEYGGSYTGFVLDDVDCNGTEKQITDCPSGTNPTSCKKGTEEASVECSSMSTTL